MNYKNWLSMSTAPKDSVILLNYFGKDVCVAMWSENSEKWVDPVCYDDYYDGGEPNGWLPLDALPPLSKVSE